MEKNKYVSPFEERYASDEMLYLFSPEKKFRTWRLLWIALARAEKELGLPITDEQIAQLVQYKDAINYDIAEKREKEVRQDVMAHIFAYGEQAKSAKGILHLGATSCYVGDNTDIIVMREALCLVRRKILCVIGRLAGFAEEYKALPTLGFTHFQPAQLTTVGKRATLWINELMLDLEEIDFVIATLRLRGAKGTTGTQASFLELFDGDHEKVKELERKIAREMGFESFVPVSGQTYSRKTDARVLSALSGVAQSASKFSNDLRLLQSMKEIEEPFEKQQIGSSAMPYKRNPMRTERMTALSRYVMTTALNPALTSASQWFERTLDDSANRRIAIAESFLAIDAILEIYFNVASGLVVYPEVVRKNVMKELPFMATENIMMDAVKKGGDRQELHEKIRLHAIEAGKSVKERGKDNDMIERIAADRAFSLSREELSALLKPEKYTGRAKEQVEEYLKELVLPLLEKEKSGLSMRSELKV